MSQTILGPVLGLLAHSPHAHGPFSVFRKVAQGAGGGALGLNGAGAFGGGAAAPAAAPVDFSSLDGLLAGLMSGALNGQLQILAGVLIFLAAGRCIARMFGLGLAILAFVAWREGMRAEDVLPFLQSLWVRSSAAYTAFMNPPA